MKKIVTLFLLFSTSLLFAAELKISVIDRDLNFALEGAKISFSGTKEGEPAFTDEEGKAIISLPDSISSGTLHVTYPGYKDELVTFSSESENLVISMSLAEIVEGEELVVRRFSPEKTEEKTGVSTVITKEEMHTTANIGLVEDCMASVRTLPGVSFSGAWGTEPSVRGGEPREMACLLDGMYTIYPWHWGGGVSIFNPSFVDSIKLSNGIFSAKYGRASSGLLEVTTLKPDFEHVHVNFNLSTTCADAFLQLPFGKDVGGMILGSHLSYLEPFVWAAKKAGVSSLDMIERAPYIRDLFMKTNFTPSPEFDVSFVAFFGSDGLEIDQTESEDGLKTRSIMNYDIYQGLAGLNVKYLTSDSVLLHGLLSYNVMYEDMLLKMSESGKIGYTDEFVSKYGSIYPGVTKGASYSLNNLQSENVEKIKNHLLSGRFESEIEISERQHICTGFEETFSTAETTEKSNGWTDIEVGGSRLFKNVNFLSENKGNCILDNAVFVTWNWGNENDLIQSEVGFRGEFITLWNNSQDYRLNIIPDICPRFSITLTPWRDVGEFEKISITTGAGLFVSLPREAMLFSKNMGLKDFDLHANRALMAVLGADAQLAGGWKLKLETYYKHYLSRIYTYEVLDASSNYQNVSLRSDSNGKGKVFGIESMIERKVGKRWDGYLSYSFIWAKMKNPANIKADEYAQAMYGSPLDEWYYPSYHRFHTLNLVSNWHFGKEWTFTLKGTLATGVPKSEESDVSCYASKMEDGTIIQRYSRSYVYSDTLRTCISFPIDIRLAYQWKTNNEKTSWEFYFAVQDINLGGRNKEQSFNRYTGKMSDVKETADFGIGMPVPSLGLKVKF